MFKKFLNEFTEMIVAVGENAAFVTLLLTTNLDRKTLVILHLAFLAAKAYYYKGKKAVPIEQVPPEPVAPIKTPEGDIVWK